MDTIELFAGGGGLALGLHDAGFNPVAVVERDTDSCNTLRENWHRAMGSDLRLFDKDIRHVALAQWQDRVELVSGGRPASPFPSAGSTKATATSATCSHTPSTSYASKS
jgi:DNA (cytosine-5)-methyltransferase 1